MIKTRDISILGLLGVVQFFVLSETFHWHYSIFIAYACFCLGYIFYKLGCDADPFWTIGRKLLYWAPIVVVIVINMSFYFVDYGIQLRLLLIYLSSAPILADAILVILRRHNSSITQMEIGAYAILWVQFSLLQRIVA